MRITAGKFAGRRIGTPKGSQTRPTQDQVRQALFNLLGDRVEGAKVLDLFAGSGSLGLEALSRGAEQVTFVDRSGFSVRAISENLNAFTVGTGQRPVSTPHCRVLRAGAEEAIRRLAGEKLLFDLVLLDPPYSGGLGIKALNALGQYAIVSASGLVIAEHDKRDPLPALIEGKQAILALQRIEQYGDTALAIYQRQ